MDEDFGTAEIFYWSIYHPHRFPGYHGRRLYRLWIGAYGECHATICGKLILNNNKRTKELWSAPN